MPITPKEIVKSVDAKIEAFQRGVPEIEKKAFREIQAIINQLKLDSNGNIKITVENLRLINKVKQRLEGIILDDKYYKKLNTLKDSFDEITTLQKDYFSNIFTDYSQPNIIRELQKVSVKSTVESLSASAINENIIQKVGGILEENIKSGSTFMDLSKSLQDFILGDKTVDSKLASYSKQILTDSLSQYASNYHKVITDDLGLEWYQYVGSLVKTSRPLCEHLVAKQWVHKSELPGIARGVIDGEKVSTAGMIPNTNGSNFQVYRGGYNCNHLLVPVSAESVPKSIRMAMYKKLGVEVDEEGLPV